MKKILFLLLSILLYSNIYSQEFPKYYIQNNDTVGITLSIEQAQKVDNDLELLMLFEKMKISCDSVGEYYIVVVNKYNKQVAILNSMIKSLNTISENQKILINNLNNQIDLYKKDTNLANNQIKTQKQIIDNQKKEITKLKIQKVIGYLGTGVLSAITVFLVITK